MEWPDYVIIAVITFVSFTLGLVSGHNTIRNEAIERGFAEYNQTTGAWQWREDK